MALRLASINRTADRKKLQQLDNKYRPPVFKVRAIEIRRSYWDSTRSPDGSSERRYSVYKFK
jgi:cobalamin biosynthesis protein CbiG